jgi:holliday junction DNA helicase RuvA
MINMLSGTIRDSQHNQITLDVSGIGFQVFVPDEHIFITGQKIELYTYMHWHQENGPQLFGFNNIDARTVFCLIIGCSGFGPRIGLAVLASLTPAQFFEAITIANYKALSAISGVGAKKAENLVLNLKDKISKLPLSISTSEAAPNALNIIKQVGEALTSLHYTRVEISQALEYVKKTYSLENSTFDDILRKTLAYLSKH